MTTYISLIEERNEKHRNSFQITDMNCNIRKRMEAANHVREQRLLSRRQGVFQFFLFRDSTWLLRRLLAHPTTLLYSTQFSGSRWTMPPRTCIIQVRDATYSRQTKTTFMQRDLPDSGVLERGWIHLQSLLCRPCIELLTGSPSSSRVILGVSRWRWQSVNCHWLCPCVKVL